MSRNFIPAILAIGMGVATGYYTFQPALRDLQSEKEKNVQQQQQPTSADPQSENQKTILVPDSAPRVKDNGSVEK